MSLTIEDFKYIKDILEKSRIKDPVVVQRGGKLRWEESKMVFKLEGWLRSYVRLRMKLPQWVGFERSDKLIKG